jgi:hypothetical protein
MPVISAAVQAGPARLLQGNPLPAFGPPVRAPSNDSLAANTNGPDAVGGANSVNNGNTEVTASNTSFDAAFDANGSTGMGVAALNGLDPRTMQSVTALARLIPSQRVSADARDDRVLISTGAQGLMQVMSKVHSDKFQYFGGQSAALEPVANIKVGALVLKDCIARGGSLPGGLRLYVGSTSPDDGGYGAKVMAERGRLRDVARGRKVPINAPQAPVLTASTNTATAAGSGKRVQVTLEGSRQLSAATPVKPPVSSEQDDASANATKHVASASELGA